jgi:hypothetical protein
MPATISTGFSAGAAAGAGVVAVAEGGNSGASQPMLASVKAQMQPTAVTVALIVVTP